MRRPLFKFDFPPSKVLRPPPPRRPCKEDWNTAVEPFKLLLPPVHQTTRTLYPRRCKRKRVTTDIESLPDELLFEVLMRIPRQQDIYEARLVCRIWYHIIHTRNFMSAYLHHSPYGLLFKSKCSESLLVLPQRGRIGIEMTQLRYNRRCLVFSSCNGLWLEKNLQTKNDLYVTNPTTGQIVLLPPCVIHVADANHAMADVDLGLISSEKASRSFCNPPLVTEGFIHWKHPHSHHLLTLNVETETITETPAPFPQLQDFPVHASRTDIYLSTGKYLSLLRPYGECSWQVWEMSRPETGEWRKKAHFSLEDNEERFKQLGFAPKEFLFPVGWVNQASSPSIFSIAFLHCTERERTVAAAKHRYSCRESENSQPHPEPSLVLPRAYGAETCPPEAYQATETEVEQPRAFSSMPLPATPS
ncbi:Unknown protein [Striga hermonthica]|uniref:F-box domain-containing protein n=1 Tax=Striga hermonthica TaxID=68872 RepID=A0A9N7NSQ6_STRHE|nr:Unknown protein [Striga hermonthica]